MKFPVFPMRQIHLDFHTSPDIPDVGADWDAEHFAQTLKNAHVNSVTIFAKCHHGMNYYPSEIGPVHPALTFDLLGEQIAACHKEGIRCPIYLSVVWDVSAAERHPEWRQVDKNGKLVGMAPFGTDPLPFTAWPWLCVNNGYADELLAQTKELIDRYGDECDGFFYDILMYNGDGCFCPQCLRSLKESGLDPENPRDRRRNNHASARRFMARVSELIRSRLPDAGIFYNSRWGVHFADEAEYYSQVEIESLPTGGWGYGFYPLWSRYGRNFGLPMLGMTGRFHRSWADWGGLKHPDALKFECGGILATGGAISVGDQLASRGRLSEPVYEVIGEAFAQVEQVEPYCIGAVGVADVALLILDPQADRATMSAASGHIEGAAKMLLELHHQFDVVTETTCADFGRYALLVLPDQAYASPETVERLRRFVAQGGKLLLSHEALLSTEKSAFLLADEMGVDYQGPAQSSPDYFQITAPALFGTLTRAGFPYSYYDGPAVRVTPRPGTDALADAYETYFNRTGVHFTSHGFTPPVAEKADYPAITRNGGVLYLHGPVFGAYQRYGSLTFRALVGKCLDLLLPEPLVETDAPPSTEVAVTRQESAGRWMVHLVNYSPQRRSPGHVEALDAPIPLRDVTVTLRGAGPISQVSLAAAGDRLPFATDPAGAVTVTVPRVGAHEIVVFQG
ncbi:MAG: alpha-L-fucosidase [Cytophagales bacterium]|nr:alpha-L-fucosidase [Armatimonadota bacterium]